MSQAEAIARPFTEQVALKRVGAEKNVFETLHPPNKMGNPLNIAYGGYAIAVACNAAYVDVPAGYHLYSMLGNYLGPAYCDRTLRASVRVIRQTRTFATRQVEVSQRRDDGELRVCLIALVDFHVQEPASLMEYSKPHARKYSHYKDCVSTPETYKKLLDAGKISQAMYDGYAKMFGVAASVFDQRPCPEGIFAQNMIGIATDVQTTQESVPMTKKSTGDWSRSREHLTTPADHVTNLAFLMDGAIAFAPLSFSHRWFGDISAASSLEFAFRVFKNCKENGEEGGLDMNKWHLREINTTAAGEGRTYGEAWLWDEEGRAVASMTQQSIMRPIVKKNASKGKL